LERGAVNDLDRAQRPKFAARQPHFPVTPTTDDEDQFVVGNAGRRRGGMLEGWSVEDARRIRWCWRLWHRSIHAIAHLGIKRAKGHGKSFSRDREKAVPARVPANAELCSRKLQFARYL